MCCAVLSRTVQCHNFPLGRILFSGFLGFQVPEAQHTNKFHLEKWNDWAQVGIRASPRSNVVNGSSAWCWAVSE
jgi:hypothetical protein